MRLGPFVILGLVLLIAAGLVAWLGGVAREKERGDGNALSASAERDASTPPLVSNESTSAVRSEGAAAPSAADASSADLQFLGRCVDGSGAPVADVAFVLQRWSRDAETGKTASQPEVEARSGADGSVAWRVEHREGNSFLCALRDARFVRQEWRWRDLTPGTRSEMGEIVVQPGVVLRGRVLDEHGAPLLEDWTVEMRSLDENVSLDWTPRAVAAGSERFEILGVPAGKWRVAAKYPGFELCALDLDLLPGEVRVIELRKRSGRDASREIVVRPRVTHLFPPPHRDHVRLLLPGGGTQPPAESQELRPEEEFLFSDLEPGTYRIEIDDPRFEPWSTDARPGPKPIVARLEGSSSLELRVLDGATSTATERFAFELLEHSSNYRGSRRTTSGSTNLDTALEQAEHPEGRATISDLVAGRLRFVLQTDGFPPRVVEVAEMQPGETRALTVELFRGTTLEGEVRRAGSGAAVEGALVALFAPAEVDDDPSSPFLPKGMSTGEEQKRRREVARTMTDASGRFRLDTVQPGTWILTATKAGKGAELPRPMDPVASRVKLEGVRIEAGRATSGLVLELPETASLSGVARVPEGHSLEDIGLKLARQPDPESRDPFERIYQANAAFVWLEASGEYRFDDLGAGRYELHVAFPNIVGQDPRKAMRNRNVASVLLEEVELAPGANERRDLDLSRALPAHMQFRLRVRGGTRGPFTVYIQSPRDSGTPPRGGRLSQQAAFDEEGLAVHPRVAAGPKLIFAFGDGQWMHVFATSLDVAPGSRHELEANIELHAGEIEVLDAAGQPLRDAQVRFGSLLDPALGIYNYNGALPLDGRARAELAVPAGRYRVSAPRRSDKEKLFAADIEWPAGALITARLVEQQ